MFYVFLSEEYTVDHIESYISGGVGKTALRIILLKTITGDEANVYNKYADFLDELKKIKGQNIGIKNWCGYKIFGEYDLCFIIERENLDHDLMYSGTIEGITYSTEILCYSSGDYKSEEFYGRCDDSPLISISIIKFDPVVLKYKGRIDAENEYLQKINTQGDLYCFGSFGWGEYVLIYPAKTFNTIYPGFIQDTLISNANERMYTIKSFSMLGVNGNLLFWQKTNNNKEKSLDIENIKTLLYDKLEGKIKQKGGFFPSFYVSCNPMKIDILFRRLKDVLSDRGLSIGNSRNIIAFGVHDFIVDIKKGYWRDFLLSILQFREESKGLIFGTYVRLKTVHTGIKPPDKNKTEQSDKNKEHISSKVIVKLSQDDVNEIAKLGHPTQETIVSTIYTFNQYLQNDMLYDSIEDIIKYVEMMKDIAIEPESLIKKATHSLKSLEIMPDLIKSACNQRLAGYLLQEAGEDFSPFKGGKQMLIKAITTLCVDIIEGIGISDWAGFVSIGRDNAYSHFYDTLSIPVDAVFHVDKYFGVFHEIGHLFLLKHKISIKNDKIKDMDSKVKFIQTMEEMLCDIFALKCGFLKNLELFMYTFIPYIGDILSKQCYDDDEVIENGLRLMGIVEYQNRRGNIIQGIGDDNEYLKRYLSYFKEPRYKPDSLKGEILKLYRNFKPFYDEIFEGYNSIEEKYKLKKYVSDRTTLFHKIEITELLNGIVVKNIEYPHLVILKLLKHKYDNKMGKLSFSTNIATIVSFVNYHYEKVKTKNIKVKDKIIDLLKNQNSNDVIIAEILKILDQTDAEVLYTYLTSDKEEMLSIIDQGSTKKRQLEELAKKTTIRCCNRHRRINNINGFDQVYRSACYISREHAIASFTLA
ncbi:hypothetical protein MBAV_002764 [Candidatus Magnetobacterium bavaricum]|uniref:Uncharacterized protein n=1 Tax=Candidatus Magnetobacterium bavaricum TaxID=29290 RepID=A0A0F3GSX2_9BACT|nr:hypothetical protein MBAV_002764 [Candidatus Magnetobacterium bavaricum]